MSGIKIKHKGHEITYREDTNDWFNEDVGAHGSATAAKKALDVFDKRDRRADITALRIDGPNFRRSAEIIEVKVGALSEQNFGMRWAFILKPDKSREKVDINSLYPLAARPRLEEYLRLRKAAKAAELAADQFLESIDGYTAETIKAAAKNEEASDKEPKK